MPLATLTHFQNLNRTWSYAYALDGQPRDRVAQTANQTPNRKTKKRNPRLKPRPFLCRITPLAGSLRVLANSENWCFSRARFTSDVHFGLQRKRTWRSANPSPSLHREIHLWVHWKKSLENCLNIKSKFKKTSKWRHISIDRYHIDRMIDLKHGDTF